MTWQAACGQWTAQCKSTTVNGHQWGCLSPRTGEFGRRRDGNMRSYAPNRGKFQFPQFCTSSFAEVTAASNASSPKSSLIMSKLYESRRRWLSSLPLGTRAKKKYLQLKKSFQSGLSWGSSCTCSVSGAVTCCPPLWAAVVSQSRGAACRTTLRLIPALLTHSDKRWALLFLRWAITATLSWLCYCLEIKYSSCSLVTERSPRVDLTKIHVTVQSDSE